jgi:hypothetical protein
MADHAPDAPALRATLEQFALRELMAEYKHLNWDRFRERLRTPAFRWIDSATLLGRWVGEERCIELARTLLFEHPWGEVIEVLLHEMAHQYVDEVLGERDVQTHGTLFREVCERFHIDARARAVPGTRSPAEQADDAARTAVLDRIAKLLALATSPNPHEAQSAMNAAHRLMLKHNLERATADRARGYVWRHLGRPMKRIESHRSLAGSILTEHFFVDAIWISVWDLRTAARGTVLEVCGTPANVDLAAYVYSFLVHTAEALWDQHKKRTRQGGLVARRSFLRGVMLGFRDKLVAEAKHEREAGLVWVADPGLDDYFHGRHPHIKTRRTAGRHDASAHAHGRAAGQKLVLHKAVEGASGGRGAGGGTLQLGPGAGRGR